MKNRLNTKEITTDVLIIGGGTAGCYAALVLSEQKAGRVLIAEKANIRRSGCLAAGVNAINAYIVKGRKPQDYVDYATKDAAGIVRQDLLLTAAENFNEVTAKMEKLGLVILKDENGDYVARGNRNIKINGENFKPLLADAVHKAENVDVLNYVNITDLLVKDGQVYERLASLLWKKQHTLSGQKQFLLQQAERPDFISRTIRDFPDIRCGIRRLTQVPDMQWESWQVRR